MAISPNQRTVTIKLTRHEVCRLMRACEAVSVESEDNPDSWNDLNEKIKAQLDEHDKKQKEVN